MTEPKLPVVSSKTTQEIAQMFRDAHHLNRKPELLEQWLKTMTEQNPDLGIYVCLMSRLSKNELEFLWGAALVYASLNGQLAADNAAL